MIILLNQYSMQSLYIQFESPKNRSGISQEFHFSQIIKKITRSILGIIIPIANPDFENKIDKVKTWLVECDADNGIPQREIGIDENGMTIVKMPFKKNYGYWTDTNLLLDGFKQNFQTQEITQEIFERKWISLE